MRYRYKPFEFDAVQWMGTEESAAEMHVFLAPGKQYTHTRIEVNCPLSVLSLNGPIIAQIGDYVTRDLEGNYTACSRDFFESVFEPVAHGQTKEIKFPDKPITVKLKTLKVK